MRSFVLLPLALLALPPGVVSAQQEEVVAPQLVPGHAFLVTGYGAAGYQATFAESETPNDFTALLVPILLFQIEDRFLFESELEFELEGDEVETGVEYAQILISIGNHLTVGTGKMLLPFNIFSERLHPAWINEFVSPPPLYGHHGGAGPADPLLPILSDVGIQLRGALDVGRFGFLTAAAFITQGPSVEEAAHEEEEGDAAIPELLIGSNFSDHNENKMLGGRLGFGVAPTFEFGLSAMTGDYDDESELSITAFGTYLQLQGRNLELRGEWILTRQEVIVQQALPVTEETLDRSGYYVQAGYRHGRWEPLVRWTQLLEGELDEEVFFESGEQLGLGLAHWLRPSLALKAEYLFNFEERDLGNNRLALQWAFGF